MSSSFIQLPPDSTGKKLDTDELTVNAQTVQRQRVLAIPPRSDQVPGRTFIAAATPVPRTSNQVLVAPTAGKTFYITGLIAAAYSTHLTTEGTFSIRDGGSGGAVLWCCRCPIQATGTNPEVTAISLPFPEPLKVTTDIYCTIIGGTVTYSVSVFGYEE